ncbi:hypothetical protein BGW80DRAFT_1562623 [Lactifluus volemus]|nr:hypothetical protein BGW80DRAFT_1562623 [Lactifluus volemus]
MTSNQIYSENIPAPPSFPILADGVFEAEGEKAKCGAVLPHRKLDERHQEVRSISRYAEIERLPNEVIREIFIFDRFISSQDDWLSEQPWKWQRLAHLFCTYGTPVKNNLDCWPPLPIVMQYHLGFWEIYSPNHMTEDEDDIMAALQNSDRICKIELNVTTRLLEKLTTLPQKPFPMLEHLELKTESDNGLILPNESFVGPFPNLHVLNLAKIAFPALQRVLPLARDLVELHLEALPSSGYITPAALLTFLPVMTRLEILYLDFHSPISRPISGRYRRAPQGRVVLLALEWFTFRGVSEDLECLSSGIDAPGIMYINVTFFNQATIFDTSQFLRFISRTQTQRSHDTAKLYCSESIISMTLTQRGGPPQMSLNVLCTPLDWQLSCMAEIFAELYPIVHDVRNFHIDEIPSDSEHDDMNPSPFLELFRPFTNVEELLLPQHVASHVRYILEREGLLPNARVTVTPKRRRRRSPIYTSSEEEHLPKSPKATRQRRRRSPIYTSSDEEPVTHSQIVIPHRVVSTISP